MATVTEFSLDSTSPQLIASGVGEVYIHRTNSNGQIRLGDSSVTTSTGFAVDVPPDGVGVHLHLGSTDELWAVSPGVGAPQTFAVIRVLHTR